MNKGVKQRKYKCVFINSLTVKNWLYPIVKWRVIKILNNNEEISKDIISIMNNYVAKVNGLIKYKNNLRKQLFNINRYYNNL